MKRDRFKLYMLNSLLLVILFIALLVSNKITYFGLALVLFVYAMVVKFTLKKKKILSIYQKQVNLLMVGFAIIYLGFFYLLGMIINDFVKQPVLFSGTTLIKFIVPLTLIIISSEVIRYCFLSYKTKIRILKREIELIKIITFVNMVLIDLIIYIGVYDLSNYNDFLTVIGFSLFASISCNLFYHYVSSRYGILGIVIYRMITVLYVYIIPIIPDIYVYFRAFLRMIYPYILYLILEHTYAKTDFAVSYHDRKKNFVSITLLLIVMALITMLISCKFKYGILVIGSESMTGAINKGDAVVFESYDDQVIDKGEVIIFKKKNLNLVHRVVDVKNVNGEIQYYTRGDANQAMDSGYVTSADIVGITKFRIMGIGYPTIWIRELFS